MKCIQDRVEAITLRKDLITEWQTKTLASFIASTVQVEQGKQNPLIEAAKEIQLVDTSRTTDFKGQADNALGKPADDWSVEEIMENGSPTAMNSPGSFERAMAGFRSS